MDWQLLLAIFIYANLFVAGAFAVLAIQYAYDHFHDKNAGAGKTPEKPGSKPVDPDSILAAATAGAGEHAPDSGHIPADVKQRMISIAENRFHDMVKRTTEDMEHDLKETTVKLNNVIDKLGSDMARDEMNRYKEVLEELRTQATVGLSSMSRDVTQHKQSLKVELDALAEMEKRQISQDMDARLADIVASFLIETMQHNIDLGAQGPYLKETLEAHKQELIDAVTK